MRPGLARFGRSIPNQPEVPETSIGVEAYLDVILVLFPLGFDLDDVVNLTQTAAQGLQPYMSNDETGMATRALYPTLAGAQRPVYTIKGWRMSAPPIPAYQIYLEDEGMLPFWTGAHWRQELNKPDTLAFTYPATAANATDLKEPARLLLYNSYGYLRQTFTVQGVEPRYTRNGGEVTIEVEALSGLAQFDDEWVVSYNPGYGSALDAAIDNDDASLDLGSGQGDSLSFPTGNFTIQIDEERIAAWRASGSDTLTLNTRGADSTTATAHAKNAVVYFGRTLAGHVEYLIENYQDASRKIALGSLLGALTGDVHFLQYHGLSLMDCIRNIYKLSGSQGQYTVTPMDTFVWVEELSHETGSVTLGSNLVSLEKTVDVSQLCTRLYAYGAGMSPETRVKLSDLTGVTLDYVSNNEATYGIKTKMLVLENVHDAATLKDTADSLIAVLSEPTRTYSVGAVDLSEVAGSGIDAFTIGITVTVTDSDGGISTSQVLEAIDKDLDSPLLDRYEFANDVRDTSDVLDALSDGIRRQENRDIVRGWNQAVLDGNILSVPRLDVPTEYDSYPRDGDMRLADYDVDGEPDHIEAYTSGADEGVGAWATLTPAYRAENKTALDLINPEGCAVGFTLNNGRLYYWNEGGTPEEWRCLSHWETT